MKRCFSGLIDEIVIEQADARRLFTGRTLNQELAYLLETGYRFALEGVREPPAEKRGQRKISIYADDTLLDRCYQLARERHRYQATQVNMLIGMALDEIARRDLESLCEAATRVGASLDPEAHELAQTGAA